MHIVLGSSDKSSGILISHRGVYYISAPWVLAVAGGTQIGGGRAGLCVLQALAVARGGGGLSAEEQSQRSNGFWMRVQQ